MTINRRKVLLYILLFAIPLCYMIGSNQKSLEQRIVNSNFYLNDAVDSNITFSLPFDHKWQSISKGSTLYLNKELYKSKDSVIYLKEISLDHSNELTIKIIIDNTYHFLRGTYLSNTAKHQNGYYYTINHQSINFIDNNGDKINYKEFGYGTDNESISVTLNNDDLLLKRIG